MQCFNRRTRLTQNGLVTELYSSNNAFVYMTAELMSNSYKLKVLFCCLRNKKSKIKKFDPWLHQVTKLPCIHQEETICKCSVYKVNYSFMKISSPFDISRRDVIPRLTYVVLAGIVTNSKGQMGTQSTRWTHPKKQDNLSLETKDFINTH